MRSYNVPASQETVEALQLLSYGVVRIGIRPGHPAHPGCDSCVLEISDGTFIGISAGQHDLEFKFEVFPLEASALGTVSEGTEWHPVVLPAPVRVSLLQTEDSQTGYS